MINWYEEEIRRADMERELCNRRRVAEAQTASTDARRFDHALTWLGQGMITWGSWLQRQAKNNQR